MDFEYRSAGLLRSADEGIVEAYLTKWGTVDAYRSTFKRGAFADSFSARGPAGIRFMWNHEVLAGKLLSCREDDAGPFVRCQCNLSTDAGKRAWEHVKHGDVTAFSFGFLCQDDGTVDGIREIRKVDVMECGPVVFEANPQAKITGFRSIEDQVKSVIEQIRNAQLSDAQRNEIMEVLRGPAGAEDAFADISAALDGLATQIRGMKK